MWKEAGPADQGLGYANQTSVLGGRAARRRRAAWLSFGLRAGVWEKSRRCGARGALLLQGRRFLATTPSEHGQASRRQRTPSHPVAPPLRPEVR